VIYIHWTVSLSRVSISAFRFILRCPRLLFARLKKTRHTRFVRITSTILCRPSLAILPVPLSVWFFHIHPFRPSSLTSPTTLSRACFSFRSLCHIVTAPHFLRVCHHLLAFRSRVCQFYPPHHPSLSCPSRMILFLYTAPPLFTSLGGRTGRCYYMWTVRRFSSPSRLCPPAYHFPPTPVVYLLAFPLVQFRQSSRWGFWRSLVWLISVSYHLTIIANNPLINLCRRCCCCCLPRPPPHLQPALPTFGPALAIRVLCFCLALVHLQPLMSNGVHRPPC